MRLAAEREIESKKDRAMMGKDDGVPPNILLRNIKFHTSVRRSLLYGFGNIVILVIGFLWFNPLHLTGPWWSALPTVLLFFLLPILGLWNAYQAIKDRPVLTLSKEGIGHTNLGAGIVRWDEILLIGATADPSAVILWLANRKEIPDGVPESKFAQNGSVVLDVEYFNKSCTEIYEAIRERLVAANPTCITAKEQAIQSRLSVSDRES